MKKFFLLIPILLLSLLMACETDTPLPLSEQKTLAGNISSRNNTTETLDEGSQILLNARGGMTIENDIFTYIHGYWSNENGYKWEGTEEETYITALYPHPITHLYEGDALKDILIAQTTLSQGETDITLTFKHLFASFTLNVDETLMDDIEYIRLTIPQKVESISTTTGEINLSDISTSTLLQGNSNSSSYTFIIPPMKASITLDITLNNGKNQTYTFQEHQFKSGLIYDCRLRDWNTVPGIRSAADFIDFLTKINGTGDVSKYGEEKDGKMIYRLLADIDLDGENISPMFNETNKPFNHTFNGENHTISNFSINAKGGFAGLFGVIGSDGIVKNLYVKDCTMSIPENASASSGVGVIGGVCTGTISNCGIINGDITNHVNSYTGGIAGTLRKGTIANCFVKNSQVKTTSASLGGIVGKIETGDIINCYSASNTITRSNNYCGGFCGFSDNGNIQNCYVYNLTFKNSTNTGQFIGRGINSNVTECYTDTGTNTYYLINTKEGNCISTPNSLYNSDFTNSNGSVYNQLNQWINNNQSSYDYTLIKWTKDETGTLPAIFVP